MGMENQNVCRFYKFGYCKFKTSCKFKHVTVVCDDDKCNNQHTCQKRHPRVCKYFINFGRCKLGSACAYAHQTRGKVENGRLEQKLDELMKTINKKDEVIRNLSNKIEDLIQKNKEKDDKIDKLANDVKELTINNKLYNKEPPKSKTVTKKTQKVVSKSKSKVEEEVMKSTNDKSEEEADTVVNDDDQQQNSAKLSDKSDEFIETGLKILIEVQEVVENMKNNISIREHYKNFVEKLDEEALAKNIDDSELKIMLNKLKGKDEAYLSEYSHTDTLKMNLAILKRDLLNHKLQFNKLQFKFQL